MNKRLEWIDIARGIGILTVILGHALTTVIRENHAWAKVLYDLIYYFHMNLMFFISGLAFNLSCQKYLESSGKDYVSKKAKKLLIPYVSNSFLVFLCFSIANSVPRLEKILSKAGYGRISFKEWIREIITAENLYCQHLWYIYSLFIFSVMAFTLLKLFHDKYRYYLLVITIIMWLFLIDQSLFDVIWKTAARGIWFAAGTFVSSNLCLSKKQRNISMVSFPVIIICILLIDFYNVPYTISQYIRIVLVLGIIFSIISFSQYLENKSNTALGWLGKNSFPIYLFHQPFFGSGLGMILYGQLHLNVFLCIIISCICCVFFPLMFAKILNLKQLKIFKLLLLG